MIEICETEASEMVEDKCFVSILEAMLVDGVSAEKAIAYLSTEKVKVYKVEVSKEVIGYFTSEASGYEGCVECHSYIYPHKRMYSMRAIKAFVEFIKERGYAIRTSVLGNFPHVLRVLKLIGFSQVKVEDSAFTKDGVFYPIFHLTTK